MTQQEHTAEPEKATPAPAPAETPASAPAEPCPPTDAPASEQSIAEQQNATQARQRAQEKQSADAGEESSAARTDPNETVTGAGGMALAPGTREIAGGGHIEEHTLNVPGAETHDPLRFHRRYMKSRLATEAGNIIARAPENIGFWGKGDTYRGNGGILVDIDTLEKHRFPDGYKFEGDAVYANSRDLPHALVDGDLTRNLSGA